jgi:hypothetical protein
MICSSRAADRAFKKQKVASRLWKGAELAPVFACQEVQF